MGSYPEWASDAAKLLGQHEALLRQRPPRGEIVSRGLEKLSRQCIASSAQLRRLVPSVVRQALVDWMRQRYREESRWESVDVDSFPVETSALPEWVEDRFDLLLGLKSPLDRVEKALLRTVLEDPRKFLGPDGRPRQSALGRQLGVDQKTICNRWNRIRQKAMTLEDGGLDSPEPLI